MNDLIGAQITEVPFGGVKESGIGGRNGPDFLKEVLPRAVDRRRPVRHQEGAELVPVHEGPPQPGQPHRPGVQRPRDPRRRLGLRQVPGLSRQDTELFSKTVVSCPPTPPRKKYKTFHPCTARSTPAGLAGEKPELPISVGGPRAARGRGARPGGGGLCLRRSRQRGHDGRQPRGVPALADRAADAARRRERDLSTTVLGTEMPAPLMLAPIGVQTIVHDDGELASARAAADARPADRHQHRVALAGGDRGGERRRAALVPALLAQRRRIWPRASSAAPRRPATGRSSSPSTPSSRAGSRATCSRRGCRSSRASGSPTTSRTRSSARRSRSRPRRTSAPRSATSSPSSPTRADLGRPRLAARAHLAADPAQGHPARRRRARGGASAASTGSSSPTTAAARSTARSPRSTRCRAIVEAVGDQLAVLLRQRRPRRRRRRQGAGARRRRRAASAAPTSGASRSTARRASRPCCGCCSPSST